MKERMRNRFKIYPAPKATISLDVFKKAIASRKQAEAQADDEQDWPESNQESDLVCLDGTMEGQRTVGDDPAGIGAHTVLAEAQVLACISDQTTTFTRPNT